MARRLRIEWAPGEKVDALLDVPRDPHRIAVLLAHGAGAGQRHPFMERLRRGLSGSGLITMTFDYAYVAGGRRAPDRLPKLVAVHRAAAERLAGYSAAVVLAGKSMGGRVGSHLAGEAGWPAAGVVYYGYPLVPLGKGEPRSTDHLHAISAPQLFFSGTRDRLSPLDLIRPLVAKLPAAALHVVSGGDHSFRVPRSSGRDADDVLAELVAETRAWVETLLAGR